MRERRVWASVYKVESARLRAAGERAAETEAYQQAGRHDEALRTLDESGGQHPAHYRMLARLGELYE